MARLTGTFETLPWALEAAARVDAALFLPRCADQCTHENGEHIGVTLTYFEVVVDYKARTWSYGVDELTLPIVGELPKGAALECDPDLKLAR